MASLEGTPETKKKCAINAPKRAQLLLWTNMGDDPRVGKKSRQMGEKREGGKTKLGNRGVVS